MREMRLRLKRALLLISLVSLGTGWTGLIGKLCSLVKWVGFCLPQEAVWLVWEHSGPDTGAVGRCEFAFPYFPPCVCVWTESNPTAPFSEVPLHLQGTPPPCMYTGFPSPSRGRRPLWGMSQSSQEKEGETLWLPVTVLSCNHSITPFYVLFYCTRKGQGYLDI